LSTYTSMDKKRSPPLPDQYLALAMRRLCHSLARFQEVRSMFIALINQGSRSEPNNSANLCEECIEAVQ
jgi:hypothetical protein